MGLQPEYVGLQAARGGEGRRGAARGGEGRRGAARGGEGRHGQAHLEAISRLCEGRSSLALLASSVSLVAAAHEVAPRPGRAYVGTRPGCVRPEPPKRPKRPTGRAWL